MGSCLPGWGTISSRNSCSAHLSPVLRQLNIFRNFVQQAPSAEACQGTAALLHWSVLGKPAICTRLSKGLVQTGPGRGGHIFNWRQRILMRYSPSTERALEKLQGMLAKARRRGTVVSCLFSENPDEGIEVPLLLSFYQTGKLAMARMAQGRADSCQ